MQIAEKHKLNESDVKINNKRIETLKNIRNFKIFEKHFIKEKKNQDFNAHANNLQKLL